MALEDERSITFYALKISQPIGDFYIGSMSAEDLFRISYFDVRGLRERDGISEYLGIQRVLNGKRVSEISRYVNTTDATFPTAVILSVDERTVEVAEVECRSGPTLYELKLRNVPNPEDGEEPILFRQIARVLDGQHRIAGLAEVGDRSFDINVALFIGLDIALQASVFSVVNLAQTKVNSSLVYDLFAYDKARSPEKTAHELAVALDGAPGSPLFEKIKRLGTATEGRFGETLSQATFVRSVVPYLSEDVLLDREIGKKSGKWPAPNYAQMQRMIFRTFFINNKDVDIAEILWRYFAAVEQRWPESWAWTGSRRMLNKTNGFQGLMRFLRPAYRSITAPGGKPSQAQFFDVLSRSHIEEAEFTTEVFRPGSSGASALYHRLCAETGLEG